MPRWRRAAGPFVAIGPGRYELRLDDDQRRVLTDLFPQLEGIMESPEHPDVRRLFPTAYPNDPERDGEYQQLMRDELRTSRTMAVQRVVASLAGDTLDDDDLQAWLQTLNAARLVLGTRLEVSEDEDPTTGLYADEPPGGRTRRRDRQLADTPEAAARFAYLWLSELLESAVSAAAHNLDHR